MLKYLISFLLTGIVFNLHSQQQQFIHQINLPGNNRAYSVAEGDYGYFLTGSLETGGQKDIWLTRVSFTGNTLWSKTFGGSGDDEGFCIRPTSDKGFVIAGSIDTNGTKEACLIKLDSLGNEEFTKLYGGVRVDKAYGLDVLPDKGYIITGSTDSYGLAKENVLLIRTDSLGDTLWVKNYGGNCMEVGRSVEFTSDSSFIIGGYTDAYSDTTRILYAAKVDDSGKLLWERFYDFDKYTHHKLRYGYSIVENHKNEYVMAGGLGHGYIDDGAPLLFAADSSGDYSWSKYYSFNSGDCAARSVEQTPDNGYVMAAYEGGSEPALLKVDKSGVKDFVVSYTDLYGGFGMDAHLASDGGYILAGYISSSGAESAFLVKTDNQGSSGSFNDGGVTGGASDSEPVVTVIEPDQNCQPLSLEEEKSKEFPLKVFPNPFFNRATVLIPFELREEKITINLYNAIGIKVLEKVVVGKSEFIIKGADFPKGIYIIRMTKENKLIGERKLIAQ